MLFSIFAFKNLQRRTTQGPTARQAFFSWDFFLKKVNCAKSLFFVAILEGKTVPRKQGYTKYARCKCFAFWGHLLHLGHGVFFFRLPKSDRVPLFVGGIHPLF